MVELNKRVKRQTRAVVFDRGRRTIVLSLEPARGKDSESIGVRLAGTRDTYRIDAASVYSIAVKLHRSRVEKRAKELNKTEGVRIASARRMAEKELAKELKSL
jgi:hypothetical protein